MREYRISVIDNMKDWEALSSSWNDLLNQSTVNTPFLTWEWLYSWAEIYLTENRKLLVLLIYEGNEIVGIAPWYIHLHRQGMLTVKRIQFLGTPESGSDYLDVISKKGEEQKVVMCLYDFLMHEISSLWDCMMLEDISSNSLFLLHFLNRIEDDGKYVEIRPAAFCPIVILPKREEDLLYLCSSNRREQYRRHLKILRSKGELIHIPVNGGNKKAIEDFCCLYEAKNEKHDKTIRSFLLRYAEKGFAEHVIHIDLYTLNGTVIGGLLHLKFADTLAQYLMAIDKQAVPQISLGNIIIGMTLINAINNGYVIYDFLKGSEAHKFHWAAGGRSSVSLHYYQKKLSPLMLAFGRFAKYGAKILLR